MAVIVGLYSQKRYAELWAGEAERVRERELGSSQRHYRSFYRGR